MELKELKQILDNAPEGATHIETGGNSNVLYWKLSESVFSTFEYWLNGGWVTTVDLAINLSSLSDIKEIVRLMEQKQELIDSLSWINNHLCANLEVKEFNECLEWGVESDRLLNRLTKQT